MMDMNMKKLLCEDTLYDQRSLVYENGVLQEVDDPRDTDKIQEGRMGEFFIKRMKLHMGLMLMLPITRASRPLDAAQVLADTDTLFALAAENRFLSVEKGERAQSEEKMDGRSDLVRWSGGNAGDGVTQWVGTVDTGTFGTMLGIVSRFSGADGSVYVLTYAGTGNYTDIRMEHREILKAFLRRVAR